MVQGGHLVGFDHESGDHLLSRLHEERSVPLVQQENLEKISDLELLTEGKPAGIGLTYIRNSSQASRNFSTTHSSVLTWKACLTQWSLARKS